MTTFNVGDLVALKEDGEKIKNDLGTYACEKAQKILRETKWPQKIKDFSTFDGGIIFENITEFTFSACRFDKVYTPETLEIGKHYKVIESDCSKVGSTFFVIDRTGHRTASPTTTKWALYTTNNFTYFNGDCPERLRLSVEAPIPSTWNPRIGFSYSYSDWFDIGKNKFIFGGENDTATKETIIEKIDPYKEHENKMKNDSKYRQFLLNQHECELCGKMGDDQNNILPTTKDGIPFCRSTTDHHLHQRCFALICNIQPVFACSFEEALDKIKNSNLFNKEQEHKRTIRKQQIDILSSIGKNPWNNV